MTTTRDRDSFEQVPYTPPPGATEVVLVRHGASAAAVAGVPFPVVDGRADPPLSEAGQRQAQAVADRLAHEPLRRAFVSPLRRTHETAAAFTQATGLEPETVEDLTEVFLGEFDGGEYRVRVGRNDPIIQQVFAEQRWDAIPGAESLDDLGRRVRGAVEHIVAETGPDGSGRVRARRRDRRAVPAGDREPAVRLRPLRQRLDIAHRGRRGRSLAAALVQRCLTPHGAHRAGRLRRPGLSAFTTWRPGIVVARHAAS